MAMRIGMRTIKTAVGACIAIWIADWLSLDYAVSAGVITILSIQNTKKSSLQLAYQRLFSAILALAVAALCFYVIGFNALAFGFALLIFIPLAVRFKLTDGIVVSSVLMTHLLVERVITVGLFANELLLMAVGAGIAILLNLYMPKMENRIKASQKHIEQLMRSILSGMADQLANQVSFEDRDQELPGLHLALLEAKQAATNHSENQFFKQEQYYLQYMDMRLVQYQILLQMKEHLVTLSEDTFYSKELAKITQKTADSLSEENPADELVAAVTELVHQFRESELPQTRNEFEHRAKLFQYMNDLRYFLEIKRNFIQRV